MTTRSVSGAAFDVVASGARLVLSIPGGALGVAFEALTVVDPVTRFVGWEVVEVTWASTVSGFEFAFAVRPAAVLPPLVSAFAVVVGMLNLNRDIDYRTGLAIELGGKWKVLTERY